MAGPNYWLDLFTAVTWQEFLQAGGKVSGFRESRWSTLQKIKPGDYFLCYLTGISRWIGLLEVTSEPFRDTATIWKDDSFPCRVKVKVVAKLTPETGIPVKEMKDQLSVFQTAGGALSWTGHFRGSPTKWKSNGRRGCRQGCSPSCRITGRAAYRSGQAQVPTESAQDKNRVGYSPRVRRNGSARAGNDKGTCGPH